MPMMIRLIITLLIFQGIFCLSAIRFGPDSSANDLSIIYQAQIKQYQLIVQRTFYYILRPFTLCTRLRPLLDIGSSCLLSNQTGPLDCFARDPQALTYYAWTLSSDFKVKSNMQVFIPNIANAVQNSLNFALSLSGTLNATKINFSFLGQPNSIFEILVADSSNLAAEDIQMKSGYANTFYEQFDKESDNLIMPQQVICKVYKDIVNLVFVGRRHRGGNDVYMVSFINYHLNKSAFLMWEGLSFSKNKVNRDMVGVYPSTAQVQDLFSLYKTAPFLDISPNINGTNNWKSVASSSVINVGQPSWFYYNQIYRAFNTGDTAGDEVLMLKIDNQYCFAAYFVNATDNLPSMSFSSKEYLHQILQCFEPDLTLFDFLALPTLLIFVLLF